MKKTYLFSLSLLASLLLSAGDVAAETTMKWCTRWKAGFVDAGFGEDLGNSTSTLTWAARYSHFQVLKKNSSTGGVYVTQNAGILDGDACTPDVLLQANTTYKFRQGTKLERISGRKIYVQPNGDTYFRKAWVWLNSYYTTPVFMSQGNYSYTFRPGWHSPETRVTVVARQVLKYYNTLEYPAYTTTKVKTNADGCDGTYNSGENICIDSNYFDLGIDHSTYKFVIGHEFGHRQAHATGGPIEIPYPSHYITDYQTNYQHPCNCLHTSSSPVCFEARTIVGVAAQEAWAFFYGAALFNYRGFSSSATDCDMSFWAKAYNPNTTGTPVLDTTPPVYVNCAFNPKWMENQCGTKTNRGVVLDWLNFYWNVWANGSHRFSVDQLSDVWAITPITIEDVEQIPGSNNQVGWIWPDLMVTVENQYPYNLDKRDQFNDRGDEAGVNH